MRTVLVDRLVDGIGLPSVLGVQSSSELFAGADRHVHMTSALRYTTLRDGKNYGGRSSELRSLPILRNRILCSLAPELQAIPRALVIPLGVAVSAALRVLTDTGRLEEEHCLFGFPHPSTGRGYQDRERAYEAHRHELSAAEHRWFTNGPSRGRFANPPRTPIAVPSGIGTSACAEPIVAAIDGRLRVCVTRLRSLRTHTPHSSAGSHRLRGRSMPTPFRIALRTSRRCT